MRVGTTPLSIHVADTVAMKINIGIAGRICFALFLIPLKISAKGLGVKMADKVRTNAAAPSKIK